MNSHTGTSMKRVEAALMVLVKNWFQEILKSRSDSPGVRVTDSVRAAKVHYKGAFNGTFP